MAPDDKDPNANNTPFVTSKSPSVARAREEWKDPKPTADPQLVAAVARAVELELGVARVIEAAVERAGDELKARLEALAQRWRDHAGELGAILDDLGAAHVEPDEVDSRLLPVSSDEISYLQGDESIVEAIDRDREAVLTALQQTLALGTLDAPAAELLENPPESLS